MEVPRALQPLALAVRGLPFALRATLCPAVGLAASACLYAAQRGSRPPGRRRLVIAAAVLAAFFALPLMFDAEQEPLAAMLSCQWPCGASLVVIAWIFGRGPLAQPMPFKQLQLLISITALPAPPGAQRFVTLFSTLPAAATAGALVAVHYALACCSMPGWLLRLLQCLLPYLFASTSIEQSALAFSLLSGVPVAPPFNRPFLSASVREWWGRWNTDGSRRFRAAAYEPVIAGCAQHPAAPAHWLEPGSQQRRPLPPRCPSQLRRWAGVFAAFGLSGAIHEMFFYYIRRRGSGGWLLFFCLQAPLMLGEARLRQLAGQAGIQPPLLVRRAATLAVLFALAQRLFVPGVMDLTHTFAEHFQVCHSRLGFCSTAG